MLTLGGRGRTLGAPTIESAIVATPAGIDLVPSNGTLSAAELGLVSSLNRESALSVLLKPIESKYDYILIDCLPSLGLLAINALRAANGIIIPFRPTSWPSRAWRRSSRPSPPSASNSILT